MQFLSFLHWYDVTSCHWLECVDAYGRKDGGGVGDSGAGGARTKEEWVVEQWVVRLNLIWGKEAQIYVPFTIDKCYCHCTVWDPRITCALTPIYNSRNLDWQWEHVNWHEIIVMNMIATVITRWITSLVHNIHFTLMFLELTMTSRKNSLNHCKYPRW